MANATPSEIKIRELAKLHGVTYTPTATDELAEAFARLSDAEVPPDPVLDLALALQRTGIVSGREAQRLYADHVVEQAGERKAP